MNPIHRITTALALVVFCALAIAYGLKVPTPVPAFASPTQFSAARAMREPWSGSGSSWWIAIWSVESLPRPKD